AAVEYPATAGPVIVSDGFVPKPCPVMVTCMLVPAFHEFGLIEVMTGVGSPMLNGAALLVPKRVNIQIVRIPFPHSSTRRIYLVTLITSVFDFTILSVSTSRRSTLTLYLPGTVISYILLRIAYSCRVSPGFKWPAILLALSPAEIGSFP